jgi:hypothetical protein
MESSSRRVSLRDGAAATRGLTNGSRGAHQPSLNIMLAHRRVDASVSPRFFPPLRKASVLEGEQCAPATTSPWRCPQLKIALNVDALGHDVVRIRVGAPVSNRGIRL